MPGARCTRGLVCQKLRIWSTRAYAHLGHTSIQVSGNTPTSPAQWLYGLLRALPGGASLLSPSAGRALLPTWRQHRGARTTRLRRTRAASFAFETPRPPHPIPTFSDDGDTPSCGHGMVRLILLIFGNGKRNI